MSQSTGHIDLIIGKTKRKKIQFDFHHWGMAQVVATDSNKESTNGTTMTQPKRSSLNHTASEAPKYILSYISSNNTCTFRTKLHTQHLRA